MADFSLPDSVNPALVKIFNNVTLSNSDDIIPVKSKLADVILPNMEIPEMPILNEGESAEITLGDYSQIYTTGEDRARVAKFTDPLNLNFKVFIDFEREAGLVANESNVNSALAYLRRIGELERYEQLKIWIDNLRVLLSDYDFLFESIDGLDIIQNQKPGQFFIYSPETIKINLRETLDMYIQSLIVTYHHICFDKIRGVSVLPSNLRKMDLYIMVYAAGYYNMVFHDVANDDTLDHLVLPTKRKLAQQNLSLETLGEFNYTLYELKGCELDQDSGSQFLSNISNEMSGDMVKNNLTFKYKFANFSGAYNNLQGGINFYSILAMMAAANRLANTQKVQQFTTITTDSPNNGFFQNVLNGTTIDETLTKSYNQFTQASTYQNIFQSIKKDTLSKLTKIATEDLPNKLLGPNSVITRTLEKFTPAYAALLVQNTIDRGISSGVNEFIDKPITKINNLILTNYSDDLVDIYKNLFPKKVDGLQVIEQPPGYKPQGGNFNYTTPDNYIKPNTLSEQNENLYDGITKPNNPEVQPNQPVPDYPNPNPVIVVNENIYDKNKPQGKINNMYVRRGF